MLQCAWLTDESEWCNLEPRPCLDRLCLESCHYSPAFLVTVLKSFTHVRDLRLVGELIDSLAQTPHVLLTPTLRAIANSSAFRSNLLHHVQLPLVNNYYDVGPPFLPYRSPPDEIEDDGDDSIQRPHCTCRRGWCVDCVCAKAKRTCTPRCHPRRTEDCPNTIPVLSSSKSFSLYQRETKTPSTTTTTMCVHAYLWAESVSHTPNPRMILFPATPTGDTTTTTTTTTTTHLHAYCQPSQLKGNIHTVGRSVLAVRQSALAALLATGTCVVTLGGWTDVYSTPPPLPLPQCPLPPDNCYCRFPSRRWNDNLSATHYTPLRHIHTSTHFTSAVLRDAEFIDSQSD